MTERAQQLRTEAAQDLTHGRADEAGDRVARA